MDNKKEQKVPDGNFPTVAYPNPEDEKAWTLALKLAKEVDADIILATDPDADRLGVYAKDSKTGEYVSFTGNMSGMLIAEVLIIAPWRRQPRNHAGEPGMVPFLGCAHARIILCDGHFWTCSGEASTYSPVLSVFCINAETNTIRVKIKELM